MVSSGVWSNDCSEIIALDLFNGADKTGERITLGMCEARLTELASHPPGHCGLCKAAARVTVAQVFWGAKVWQDEVAATRRLAGR